MVNKGTGTDNKFVYEYNLKDHLGNNRVTFLGKTIAGGVIEVMQTSHYYPFGLTLSQNNYNPATGYSGNKYLYNGKEIQDERFGDTFFGMLDYGARFYDPQIGRFHSIDPMTVFTPGISPYSYADDNPINYIDYYGLGPLDWWRKIKDFVMTNILGATKYGSWTAGNVYYRFLNTGSSASPNYATYGPHEPRAPYAPGPPEGKYGLMASNENIPTPEVKIPDPFKIIDPIPPPITIPPPGGNHTFTKNINFKFRSNEFYNLPATEKTLSDLVKTLQDYPQLEVRIIGNIYGNPASPTAILNGNTVPVGSMQRARADAVLEYLESKGISRSRMQAWRGNVYSNAKTGQTVSFILKNP